MIDGSVFVVGTLHNRIDWAGLLAESAIDALGHIDVISSCSPRSIWSRLALDGDGVGRASCCAQLAGDAAV